MNFKYLYIVGLPTGSTDICRKADRLGDCVWHGHSGGRLFYTTICFCRNGGKFYGNADIGKGTVRV